MQAVADSDANIGLKAACEAIELPRATYYRMQNVPFGPQPRKPRPRPERALSAEERQQALDLLHSERFCDSAPGQVCAELLDEGIYICSVSSMYRILEAEGEVKERRNLLNHPNYNKPELLAENPNQVWSWDITKLKGPEKWTYYQLYVIMDIYSRYVVGWMIADRENAELAKKLINNAILQQKVQPGQLTIHADRGASMKSKAVAFLLADLGVTKTHSRPYVSDDNPFSESQFKTLKYRPEFPEKFGSIQDARAFCQDFFDWYNKRHRHTGIAMLTPEMVHYGLADEVIAERQKTLDTAFKLHPERFVNKRPEHTKLPPAVWINPPGKQEQNK